MDQAWKDKHIRWFVAQSPLWGGVVANLPAIISGVEAGGLPSSFVEGFVRKRNTW